MSNLRKWISCIVCILMVLQFIDFSLFPNLNTESYAQEAEIKINFQSPDARIPEGYIPDYGELYDNRNAYSYGWNKDHTDLTLFESINSDFRLDTGCRFYSGGSWEIELISGSYNVTVSVGDAVYSTENTINAEDTLYWDNLFLEKGEFAQETRTIEVNDGKLTISQGNEQTIVNYIEIVPAILQELPENKDITPPTVPQNLTSENIEHDEVTLSWDSSIDDTSVEGYIIYRDGTEINTVVDCVYYTDTGLLPFTTYDYEVAAFDMSNNISSKSKALNVTTATKTGNGVGLKGEYFNSSNLDNLAFIRTDKEINFDWGAESPDININPDEFSVRWTGQIEPRFSEVYTFYTETHGGVRLWIDEQLIIDEWNNHNMVEGYKSIFLEAGKRYDIKLEYCEMNGAAIARLLWSSKSQNKMVIPTTQLYPPFIPECPENITGTTTSTMITLSWNQVQGVSEYDIEADGIIINNGSSTEYKDINLEPNSFHNYRIRAKVPGVIGNWGELYTYKTKIGVPQNIQITANEDSVKLAWDEVPFGDRYEIEVDGEIVDTGEEKFFEHLGLMPNTQHTYRIRAINEEGTGDWSDLFTKTVLSEMPTNIQGVATSNTITITWDPVISAISYDVEIDGEIINNGMNTTYMLDNLLPSTQHEIRVRAIKSDGIGPWSQYIIISTLPEPGNGIGLKGEYFDNPNLTNMKFEQIDEQINFEWKNNSPITGENKDEFSIRWTGEVEPRFNEPYTFYAEVHGGVRLWIDGKLVIDEWTDHNMVKEESGTISLESGKRYDLKLEYRETNGTSKAKMMWSSPSQAKEIIPKSQLYPIGIPQNIKLDSTLTKISVEWDDVIYADEYDIEVDGEIVNNDSNTIFTHDNLVPGTRHTYRIRARDGIAIGEWSPIFNKTTLLGKPKQINVNDITERQISLSWDSVYGGQYYDIEVDGTIINNGDGTSYIHTDLSPGTLHSYRVRARSDYVTGEWTNLLEKWTLPDVPQNITTASSRTEIIINWDKVIGATEYEVEIYGTPVKVPDGMIEFVHTELNPNTQYTYRVRAINDSGYGKWSSVIAETTLTDIPNNIRIFPTDSQIKVSWDPVAGATAYDIEIDNDLVVEVKEPVYTHENLDTNTTHTYRIRSKNVKGISNWSSPISRTTLPHIPSNLKAEVTSISIKLTWDQVEGVSGYDIEVDGLVIDNGSSTSYMHKNLEPNTEHSYRVRAKNENIYSFWTDKIVEITILESPKNLNIFSTSNKITLTWDPVIGAESYEVEVNGYIVDNGLNTIYILNEALPNTEYIFRVRAKNIYGASEWSEAISRKTSLDRPQNLKATVTSTSITINWDPVDGAQAYDILVDGQIVDVGNDTVYVHENLEPNSWHVYRVRARNEEITGDWSEVITQVTMLGIPTNIIFENTTNRITVSWDEVKGATGYDIEVDRVLIDNGSSTSYTHEGLDVNTIHTYRVRAKNENGTSEWSELISILTGLAVPENLRAEATTTYITLMWDKVYGASSYDIEVDGEVIRDVTKNEYLHEGLKANTWHEYRVRARADGNISEWSEVLQKNTIPEMVVEVAKDNMFNFVVVAPEKKGITTRTITVTYNPDELEVIDLCALTPELEHSIGKIEGTNINIETFTPGKIVYSISDTDKTIVNSIKFISKVNEYTNIVYEIE